ncbi:hypothetical protein B0T25DRAFT_537162 [Lasiosphaeria hispida]|uniref:Secreted protein n=1 Tax=Lasiosphaeria hispida TaxID=260671 RepID=A0AAJ0HKP7_9PEZI|nr:hypothetical protein B0T25DRAFT_537162 [Lasiosphaeria hispida]
MVFPWVMASLLEAVGVANTCCPHAVPSPGLRTVTQTYARRPLFGAESRGETGFSSPRVRRSACPNLHLSHS